MSERSSSEVSRSEFGEASEALVKALGIDAPITKLNIDMSWDTNMCYIEARIERPIDVELLKHLRTFVKTGKVEWFHESIPRESCPNGYR
jgi:hypothetical protein